MSYELQADSLWLIPVVLALIFMLWAIWELEKQIRLEKRRANAMALSEAGSDRLPLSTASEGGRSTGRAAQLQFR